MVPPNVFRVSCPGLLGALLCACAFFVNQSFAAK